MLVRIMPPHPGAGEHVEWEAIECSWGTNFPRDYKGFMSTYGSGGVNDYLEFLLPGRCSKLEEEFPYQGMFAETQNARNLWKSVTGDASQSVSIIAWGVDSSADILCWLTSGDTPDSWPVVVWNQDDARWTKFSCGMVEFICRLFRADFPECPLGGVSLWGDGSPRFLHRDEERRIRDAGIDPWSGRPDLFAGMEFD
jgi:hypothetical protein